MQEHFITVRDYSTYVGNGILSKIEQQVIEIRLVNSEVPIILDFEGTSLQDTFLERLASICAYNDCQVVNLGGREEQIALYIQKGYFEMRHIGHSAYIKRLRELIERADYPFLIWDMRGTGGVFSKQMSIVRPLYFTQHKMIFHELRSQYTQPKQLRMAIEAGKIQDLFVRNEVYLSDIDNKELCFRFANTKRERVILDLIEGILNKQFYWITGGE